jgi:hypothetical protein
VAKIEKTATITTAALVTVPAVAEVGEAVDAAARQVDDGAGAGDEHVVAEPEGELAVDHVDKLVGALVKVQGRTGVTAGDCVLDDRAARGRVLAAQEDRDLAAGDGIAVGLLRRSGQCSGLGCGVL